MKRIFIIALSLLMILTNTYNLVFADEAAGEFSELNFDFEDYTLSGNEPEGFLGSSNIYGFSPIKMDENHGTSFKASKGSVPRIPVSGDTSNGKFLLSFEFATNIGVSTRLSITPSDVSSEGFNIFYINTSGEVCSSSTGAGDWNFTPVASIEEMAWNQVDMILDMDEHILTYYVNGINMGTKPTYFNDIVKFVWRCGESGSGNFVLDNFSYKKFDDSKNVDGTIKATQNGLLDTSQNSLDIMFSQVVDADTLSDISVQNLGNNPISFSGSEISFDIGEVEPKMISINLHDGISAGDHIRVKLDGVKSIFGKAYENDKVFFTVKSEPKEVSVYDADFTNIVQPQWSVNQGSWKWVPIIPNGSTNSADKWTNGGACNAFPCDNEDDLVLGEKVTAVEFVQTQGGASNKNGSDHISRILPEVVTKKAIADFKVKVSTAGNFTFAMDDSSNRGVELVRFKPDGLYAVVGNGVDTKVMDYEFDQWYEIKVELDLNDGLYSLYVNDELIQSELKSQSTSFGGSHAFDIKRIRFVKTNAGNTYGDDNDTLDDCAHVYLAYCNISSVMDTPVVQEIYFRNDNGQSFYPDEEIPANVTVLNVKFAGDIDGRTLDGNITLCNNDIGEEVVPEGFFDNQNALYSMTLPNCLAGDSTYSLSICSDITDYAGNSIDEVYGDIYTGAGSFEVNSINADVCGTTVNVGVDVFHSDGSEPTFYLIYAGYQGTKMKGFDFETITLEENERKVSKNATFEVDNIDELDYIKGFIWDGFDTLVPLFDFYKHEF